MPKKSVSVEVESSSLEIMGAVAAVVAAARAGGSASAIAAGTAHLVATIQAIQALPADLKEDRSAFIRGAVLGAEGVVEALLA